MPPTTSKTTRKPASRVKTAAKKKTPVAKTAAPTRAAGSASNASVEAFLAALEHPMKRELEAVRKVILGVSPAVREEIKWNAPSFYTTEHFATFNLRAQDRVRLILHTGAKVKAGATRPAVADPEGLLEWLGKDRAMVTLGDSRDVKAKSRALAAILAEWIQHV